MLRKALDTIMGISGEAKKAFIQDVREFEAVCRGEAKEVEDTEFESKLASLEKILAEKNILAKASSDDLIIHVSELKNNPKISPELKIKLAAREEKIRRKQKKYLNEFKISQSESLFTPEKIAAHKKSQTFLDDLQEQLEKNSNHLLNSLKSLKKLDSRLEKAKDNLKREKQKLNEENTKREVGIYPQEFTTALSQLENIHYSLVDKLPQLLSFSYLSQSSQTAIDFTVKEINISIGKYIVYAEDVLSRADDIKKYAAMRSDIEVRRNILKKRIDELRRGISGRHSLFAQLSFQEDALFKAMGMPSLQANFLLHSVEETLDKLKGDLETARKDFDKVATFGHQRSASDAVFPLSAKKQFGLEFSHSDASIRLPYSPKLPPLLIPDSSPPGFSLPSPGTPPPFSLTSSSPRFAFMRTPPLSPQLTLIPEVGPAPRSLDSPALPRRFGFDVVGERKEVVSGLSIFAEGSLSPVGVRPKRTASDPGQRPVPNLLEVPSSRNPGFKSIMPSSPRR